MDELLSWVILTLDREEIRRKKFSSLLVPSFQCTEKRGENTLFYLCTERQEQLLVLLLPWFLGQDLSKKLPDIPGRLDYGCCCFL